MSDDTVGPAMTPEEWRDLLSRQYVDTAGWGDHRLAAFALYGEPFGFTQRVVDLLRAGAAACRGDDHHIAAALDDAEWSEGRGERLAAEYERAAAVVAALLPPE